VARARHSDGLGTRDRYREETARLADMCGRIEGNPFPALLDRIDAGETIHNVHGYELDLTDVDGFYDLEPDSTLFAGRDTATQGSGPVVGQRP